MNIATVASDTVWKDAKANIKVTEKHVARVMELHPKTDVILFPEISLAGFIIDESNMDVAESMDGYCVDEIKRIAKKYAVALICGMIEENPKGKPYNTQFVVTKEGVLLAKYHKNHLFTGLREIDVYAPGETLTTFELAGWKCGIAICFDNRFPRLFEAYKKVGVECIFCPCNWVYGRNKPAIFENLAKVRAHENQCFYVSVDRSGSDPNTSYHGISIISNPYCEDVAIHDGIYSYAEIDKEEIAAITKAVPLTKSFKSSYKL